MQRQPPHSEGRRVGLKLLAGIGVVGLLVTGYWIAHKSGALEILLDGPALRERISRLGALGPLAVIGSMAAAIVLNPVPSAPIAVTAGAVYGHTWGTVYIVLGAEAGALGAFGIARLLGSTVVEKLFRRGESMQLLGSQNTLMVIVFVSRLIPFISFDLVSYAAGLTPLATWRFALATLAGILPASFLLAHFGAEMASADAQRIMISIVALGALTLIPVAINVLRSKRRRTAAREKSD